MARGIVAILLALVALAGFVPGASAQTSGGTIAGKVQGKDGAPMPGVTVTASNKDTGLDRSTTSASDGAFLLPSLPVGTYTVKAELEGFATVSVSDVKVNVASTRNLEINMSSSNVQEAITVVDEAPLVQSTPSIGAVVSQEQLENLPLNGRQFANLAVLAPGTALAYNGDPTKPGQLTVALNGGSGRNVNFIIDGGDNTDDTIGGALQNFNLESVQEFNIQTQQYKAEYGRSTGGVLTVVTKSGTNKLEGSAWGFYRKDSLASKTETEKIAGIDKQKLERKQYGASLGGPIVKDKVHFFATYEKTDRDTNYSVNTPLLPADNGKSFPTPFKDDLATAKLTWDVSPKQYLQVRYGYQKNTDKYGASPLAAPDSLGTVTNKYSSILAGHTLQLGADSLNEMVFQYTKFDNLISADSDAPTVYYPSGVHFGQNINTPQSTHQIKYQYKDDLSFSRTLFGHTNQLKLGLNYIHEPTLGGDFSTGLAGQYTLKNDVVGSPVTDITIFGGFFGNKTPVNQYSGYFQDDLFVNDHLTVNVGLRYDYWTGFDLDQRSNPIWQALSSQTKFSEYYLRDFKGGNGGVLKNDKNNWAPRLGFTYDVSGNGQRLIHGGWGLYYDFPYTNATILFPAAAVQSNYGVVYNAHSDNGFKNPDGSFFQPGQPLPPNQLPGAAINPPNEVASPTLQTPYSAQGSLGYSWQATSWLGLNVEGVVINYRHIPYRFRANPFVDANGNGVVDPTETRRFPQFGNFRLWYGNGQANYQGVNLSARARLSDRFEVQGFYTYSETEGNVLAGADEFRITNAGYQADVGGGRRDVSVNPLDPQCGSCFGPLDTDARHRVTLSAVYRANWGINLSGMFRYHSATPYTNFIASDLNGDGFAYDLPARTKVNAKRGASFSQFDLRIGKEFHFGSEYSVELIGEVFNLFNEKNPAVFNRNGQATAYAGDPLQGEQRLAQLGLRLHF
jgi:hypothetical protein